MRASGFLCLNARQNSLRVQAILKTRRTEEDDGVLNLLTAKTRYRLGVLRQNAQNSPIRTVKKRLVAIGQRCGCKFAVHAARFVSLSIQNCVFSKAQAQASMNSMLTSAHYSGRGSS